MMQAFRSSAKIIAVVFAVLMLLFLLELSGITGGRGGGLASGNSVGKIDGQSVDARVYQEAVQERIRMAQQQSSGPLSMEDIEAIRDEVWNDFVTSTVLAKEYQRRGISVSPTEVADALKYLPPQEFQNLPDFQTDSAFDVQKYQRWLSSAVGQQYIPYLENRYRSELLRQKLLQVVTADVYLSDAALWQRWRDEHESVKIGLTPIVPHTVVPDSAVTVTEDDIRDYYRNHQDALTRPASAFLSYVAMPWVTNASDTLAALTRARTAREEILGGTPFAEVARRESADTSSAGNGGTLGEWTRGDMVPAFDSVAFSIPLNTLSQPIRTRFGYHLIEITSRKGDKASGRHILIPIEVTGEHLDQLNARADSLETLGAERLDPAALDTVSRALGLPIGVAGPVEEGTRVQLGVRVIPDVGVWAFRAQRGETSHVIETESAYYVFRLDSLIPAGVPPLSDPSVQASVRAEVRDLKKWTQARAIAADFVKRLEAGATMPAAATAMGLQYREFGPFTRTRPPLPNPIVIGAAFGIPVGQRSGVLDTKEGLYVVKVLERTPADSAEFLKAINEYRAREIRLARQDRIRFYLSSLTKSADIVDHRNELIRTNAQAEADIEAQNARLPQQRTGL